MAGVWQRGVFGRHPRLPIAGATLRPHQLSTSKRPFGRGSEVKRRVLSAVLIAPPLVLFVLYGPPWALGAVVLASALLGLREFFLLTLRRWRWSWLALGGIPVVASHWGVEVMVLGMASAVTGSFSLGILRGSPSEGQREALLVTAGMAYISLPMAHLILAGRLPHGIKGILLLLAAVWTGDTLALMVGRRWGKRALAPRVSPKKTVEGALATFGGVGLAVLLLRPLCLPDLSPGATLLFVLGVGILSQIGDLSESLLKRAAGVKDSGGLIPGHGGMLDRMDSFIFTSPFLYYLLRAF
ncbi:MAG: hypothetical protein DRG33_04375 [Deltaproteobacteria bacterium]|nr:MAG: hypothetical protein DRG33_04375 [Deltaproteobacteria bacterium]